MKILLCIVGLVFGVFKIVNSQTIETIFTYEGDDVCVKSEYIAPFYFNYQGATSYLLKSDTVSSKDSRYSYTIKLSNYKGTENDGGFYRMIDIECGNENILNLKQSDGWDKLKDHVRAYATNDYFLAIPLTDSSTALIFVGYPYNSQPELLTIVILDKDKATLVFNREIIVREMEYDKTSSTFVMNLQDYPIEYLNETTPANTANLFKIFLEKGVLRFGGSYGSITK